MQSLPVHLLQEISSYLFYQDYVALRSACQWTLQLPSVPTLKFHAYCSSALFLGPFYQLNIDLDDLNDERILYLMKNDLVDLNKSLWSRLTLLTKHKLFHENVLNNELEKVQFILKQDDEMLLNDSVFPYLAAQDRYEMIQLLLRCPWIDPSVDDNYALQEACYHGHTQVVQLLLKDSRVDPTVDDYECIKEARLQGHKAILKLLLAHPLVKKRYKKPRILPLHLKVLKNARVF